MWAPQALTDEQNDGKPKNEPALKQAFTHIKKERDKREIEGSGRETEAANRFSFRYSFQYNSFESLISIHFFLDLKFLDLKK
ncbi:hypothetical protein AQUCO_09500002v1 [Aquilegia coerulea]|uniref:Uncharacterized protein n=1 Tax=Aquilegia coerulea TaxID=218851 RepID=A0A2G5C4R7_AQUCA|nr:hypothetical protein AQUCO_09500002v1 [Aquilegia coerulea]